MMYLTITFAAMLPLGFLMTVGAFGTWGWNERAGIVSGVMGLFCLLMTVLVWEQQYESQCAAAGGIVLDFMCVEADAIIVLP